VVAFRRRRRREFIRVHQQFYQHVRRASRRRWAKSNGHTKDSNRKPRTTRTTTRTTTTTVRAPGHCIDTPLAPSTGHLGAKEIGGDCSSRHVGGHTFARASHRHGKTFFKRVCTIERSHGKGTVVKNGAGPRQIGNKGIAVPQFVSGQRIGASERSGPRSFDKDPSTNERHGQFTSYVGRSHGVPVQRYPTRSAAFAWVVDLAAAPSGPWYGARCLFIREKNFNCHVASH
jgi:hypothetical protein